MKAQPAGLSIDSAKKGAPFLLLKQTGLLLNLNIIPDCKGLVQKTLKLTIRCLWGVRFTVSAV